MKTYDQWVAEYKAAELDALAVVEQWVAEFKAAELMLWLG